MTPFAFHTVTVGILILLLRAMSTSGLNQHYTEEGNSILRRFSDAGHAFDGHDVASVHLAHHGHRGQTQGRRLQRRDVNEVWNTRRNDNEFNFNTSSSDKVITHLQLDLSSSGFVIDLKLEPLHLVDEETIVYFQSSNASFEEKLEYPTGCISYGTIEDSSGKGWVGISHCRGIFGFANSPGFEYFLQPLSGDDASIIDAKKRSKREATDDENASKVHVVWRSTPSTSEWETDAASTITSDRSAPPIVNNDVADDQVMSNDVKVPKGKMSTRRLKGTDADRVGATGIVVEIAMFTDAAYWKQLHKFYPGRENDFLVTRLASTQALYGNRQKMGYDVTFKLKHIEHWEVNPSKYAFTEKLSNNLRSFCKYTRGRYFYDVLALNTGLTNWRSGKVGLAYLGGACSLRRCLVTKGYDIKTFVLYAHELGHLLGLSHMDVAKCPTELKVGGGFMGGGNRYNFSPCMKHQLGKFLSLSKSNCLFRESAKATTPAEFHNLPKMLAGQIKSPDELCHMLAGPKFNYVALTKKPGVQVCHWFLCLNEDESSPEVGRVRRFKAPTGFPCQQESFCTRDLVCVHWKGAKTAIEYETVRNLTKVPVWSEWSSDFSSCSRSCGTGVRVRRRQCEYEGFTLAPFCHGPTVDAVLCNTKPCPREPTKYKGLRHARGREVCKRFLKGGIQLRMSKGVTGYKAVFSNVRTRDAGANIDMLRSKSCLVKCRRNPKKVKGDLDAFMPDGTLCTDGERPRADIQRFNIQRRCVRGFCQEFSDCTNRFHVKDKCGICDGDGSRCVELRFGSKVNVPRGQRFGSKVNVRRGQRLGSKMNVRRGQRFGSKVNVRRGQFGSKVNVRRGQRSYLTKIPKGSSNIDVSLNRKQNPGVVIELWNTGRDNIIGRGGLYPKVTYRKSNSVRFAGTEWMYQRATSYLRASGPITEDIIIRAYRASKPISLITAKYAKPLSSPA